MLLRLACFLPGSKTETQSKLTCLTALARFLAERLLRNAAEAIAHTRDDECPSTARSTDGWTHRSQRPRPNLCLGEGVRNARQQEPRPRAQAGRPLAPPSHVVARLNNNNNARDGTEEKEGSRGNAKERFRHLDLIAPLRRVGDESVKIWRWALDLEIRERQARGSGCVLGLGWGRSGDASKSIDLEGG